MSYTILNVAFPFAPVREDSAGGAEQIVLALDTALVAAGHCSIVAAAEDSSCKGIVVTTRNPFATIDDEARTIVWQQHRISIAQALRRWPIDLIHLHGIDFYAYLPPPGIPVLVTLHLPPQWYPPQALYPGRARTYFNCVSAAQERTCPPVPTRIPFIENGVAVDSFSGSDAPKEDFALALGRICPEKGYHLALAAARRAEVALTLAGSVFGYADHERYFASEIVPFLDGTSYRFVGPVDFKEKKRLLSAARCLLIPSLAPETSSLVAMEALSCGTPVIAFPSGALADIVEHGRTGFLVRDHLEMAEAIRRSARIDPAECRSAARERFSATTMLRRYFEVYREIIEGRV